MKNKSSQSIYCLLLVFCVSIISIDKGNAQEKGIFEINDNLYRAKPISKKGNINNRDDFYNLTFKLHPTAYIENGDIKKIYGQKQSIKLTFEDAKSFKFLSNGKLEFNQVELITIIIKTPSDLNNNVDFSVIEGLTKLKYVYIKCFFKCTDEQIKAFVKLNSGIRVFYNTETPS